MTSGKYLLIAVLLAINTISSANTDTLDYMHVFDLEVAAKPLIVNHPKAIIYERQSMNKMQDRRSTALWMIDLKTRRHVPLVNETDNLQHPRSAIISPDGERIAFIANDSKGAQIFTLYLDNKQITQVTKLYESPSNLSFSPDGKQIAFSMFTPEPEEPLFNDMPKAPKGAQWAGKAQVINRTIYRQDGRGYVKNGYQQLYLVPSDGGTPRQLTTGKFHHQGQLAWHPNQATLFFAGLLDENWELMPLQSNIYALDLNTLETRPITQFPGPESHPVVVDDGNKLAFTWVDDRKLAYQNSQIMLIDLRNLTQVTSLTPSLDRQIREFSYNGEDIYFSYLDGGETRLASVNLKGKLKKFDVELGGQSIGRPYTSGEFAVDPQGNLVIVEDNSNQPGNLVYIDGKKRSLLADINQDVFTQLETAKINKLTVKSSVDGREIDAWIAYPPDFQPTNKQAYPLILEIHGGPHAAYGDTFSMEVQLMAAKGYAVLWSNPRGSASYGEAFGNTIHHNYPSHDYDDLMDVVDAAIATGHIDSNNLFITGGSGGGVLTAWSIGKTDRFAAAVVAKPVINWLSFALTADAYPFFSQYWMPGKPWEVHEHLWKHSPLSLVKNVTTPTMLLTGEADYRTPISETEQYYNALRLQEVPSVMVRIPGASHGIAARPSHLIQKVGYIISWFERYKHKQE